MFGLASRSLHLRVETRARNAVTMTWPDADHAHDRKGSIAGHADAMMFGPHTARLLRAAMATGVDARASRDAGNYLCNYLSWRAIEAVRTGHGPRLAAFVHVPLLARDGSSQRRQTTPPLTLEQLVDAGEAVLMELVKLTRMARPFASFRGARLASNPDICDHSGFACFRIAPGMTARVVNPTPNNRGLSSSWSRARGGIFALLRHCGRVTRVCAGNAIMDLNRRHLIGASVTGVAGALAMSPDAARAAPLTSAAWARCHAIRRPARQPGRTDPGLAARHRRERARASAAGAAARGLPYRHASATRTARNSWACAARPGSFSPAAHRCFRAKARQASA